MTLLNKRCNAIIKHFFDGLKFKSQTLQLFSVEFVIWSIHFLEPENHKKTIFNLLITVLFLCRSYKRMMICNENYLKKKNIISLTNREMERVG